MPLLDLGKITKDLPTTWDGYLRDWDRTLRSANRPETTRYNYLLGASQLARYLAEYSPDPDADAAAQDPTEVTRAHIEHFQAWMIDTRSAATAINKHKVLKQFFTWLRDDEEDIDHHPMERVKLPKAPKKLVPIMRDGDTKELIAKCHGKSFAALRDEAIIRLYYSTGARLSEVANLDLGDLDEKTDSVLYHGKGAKDRRVRYPERTAQALTRYLRARAKHKHADLTNLWLAERGRRPLQANGIKIMLKRRGERAGLGRVHAHRWRHNYAHEFKRRGGDTGDLMILLGWSTEAMPRHYGESAAAERAAEAQLRIGVGQNV